MLLIHVLTRLLEGEHPHHYYSNFVKAIILAYILKCMGRYSNGEVHLWDLEEEDECTFSPSSKAHTLSDLEGNIPNYVTSVALSPQFTAALYSGGQCPMESLP